MSTGTPAAVLFEDEGGRTEGTLLMLGGDRYEAVYAFALDVLWHDAVQMQNRMCTHMHTPHAQTGTAPGLILEPAPQTREALGTTRSRAHHVCVEMQERPSASVRFGVC